MELRQEIKRKIDLHKKKREKQKDIEEEIQDRLSEEGFTVVGVDANSEVEEFTAFIKCMLFREDLNDLDNVFDDFQYTALNPVEKRDSMVFQVSFGIEE